ncbi:MAG: glycosyltransferase family 4 protein [Proteobacteria bacterium]|nr:glycosyltransferase family 4 protein [Pseudomonadota bacterium]
MRIAHIVPVLAVTPPIKYGGIERIAAQLAEYQASQGHRVTVFCAGESALQHPNIKLEFMSPFPTLRNPSEHAKYEVHEFLSIIARQDEFDLIHFHFEPIISNFVINNIEINLLRYLHVPFINTFHNMTSVEKHQEYYKKHTELRHLFCNFVSKSQQLPLKEFFPNSRVIYNSVPVEKFTFNPNPEDYFAFIGRIVPEKGIKEAIEVAKRSNHKLIIAAKADKEDLEYLKTELKDLVDGEQIKFIGEVDHAGKVKLLSNAKAMLFPIKLAESFGLVMAESLACGTPVVATKVASVPEVIDDGITGIVGDSVEELIQRLPELDKIDRKKCREVAETRFANEIMCQKYDEFYQEVIVKFSLQPKLVLEDL